jgi:hypothetical protein
LIEDFADMYWEMKEAEYNAMEAQGQAQYTVDG